MTFEKPYCALLLDLFWTTVDMNFDRFPKLRFCDEEGEKEIFSTGDLLFQIASQSGYEVKREEFIATLLLMQKRVRQQWQEGETEELSSQKKFAEFLRMLPQFKNLEDQKIENLAEDFTQVHMHSIIEATVIPDERKKFLRQLQKHHRLALVSNFDHAASGYRILQVHDIADCFEHVVISDEWGKRKPHPEIFDRALKALGVDAQDALMVGDTPHADIAGAARLGMDTVWIRRGGQDWPSMLKPATFILDDLAQLDQIPRVRAKTEK